MIPARDIGGEYYDRTVHVYMGGIGVSICNVSKVQDNPDSQITTSRYSLLDGIVNEYLRNTEEAQSVETWLVAKRHKPNLSAVPDKCLK